MAALNEGVEMEPATPEERSLSLNVFFWCIRAEYRVPKRAQIPRAEGDWLGEGSLAQRGAAQDDLLQSLEPRRLS